MAQLFHLFHRELTVTSSPIEVRVWIEELDYSFLVYGENFERAQINGEKLLNITRQKLKELGIIRTDHQDIILKAVANINKKTKVEEQAMQGEDQNDKKMPTRFRKQSEHLEHAIDRVLIMISERRRTRILRGTNEEPPHNILTAALELINVVKMILNILERPPLDCMPEFSSLKNHLIKHITLLKHFSEQSDLNNEMESDIIDVCKDVTKMCHYIIDLPPELTGPEEVPPRVQVPIAIEHEAVSFSVEHVPDDVPPTQHLSMSITITSSSSEPVFPLQDMPLQNKIVLYRSEYFSPEKLNTPSNEETVTVPHDDENKSETEVYDTKGSDTLAGSLDYTSLQDLVIIESGSPVPDSGSEKCVIDSDSDRGIGLDYDVEKQWKDSDSIIWGTESDSETCPVESDSAKHLLEPETYQIASSSVQDLTESEQHLVGVEQFQVEYDSLKYWMDSDSEKCLKDSDSEKFMDSDNERLDIDSDSEKGPMASASVKQLLKAEKCQMASDSIKRLMESEKRLIEIKQHYMLSASEEYVMESDMEKDKMGSASACGVQLMGEEKYQEKTRSNRYKMDSDSEPCGMDLDSERHALATAAAKCLVGNKTHQLSAKTEGHWVHSLPQRHKVDLDSEGPRMASDTVKHMMKAESSQSEPELEKFWIGLKSESKKSLTDSEKRQLDFDYDSCRDSSRSAGFQGSSETCQVDFQKLLDNFERHQIDCNSKKRQSNSENEKHQNEFESEKHMVKMEREQCLMQSENEKLQMDEEQEKYDTGSDREKLRQITFNKERHHLDSENEAQRLGARKKDNRPHGFWRPVFLTPPFGRAKKTEERYSMQQTGNKVSRIQHVRHLSDENILRYKEVSSILSNRQDSQPKLEEKHSHNLFLDPNTLVDNKHQRNASHESHLCKSDCKEYKSLQSFQSSGSQLSPLTILNAKDYTSEVSVPDCHLTSVDPWSAVRPKIHRYSSDTRATICSKCFKEISNSHFHKCFGDFDNNSHLQTPLGSKYCMSPKSIRHRKTSRSSPLSRPPDSERPVGFRCPLHRRDSKYSLGSTSYLHCGSCSALQNLLGTTVTRTFLINPQNATCRPGTPGPDNIINVSNVVGLESEGQFNLTHQIENEANPDNETKLDNANNLKNEANAKDKPILKDERDHEDETDSEDEKDSEDEEDLEDENNTKDKKDPKDKSDPDNTDPKDSNAENDADANNGSDYSGDADPTSGADSNSDGDSNNGTDSNNKSDSTTDKGTNNDANSKYSTDSEEDKYTNNSNNTSGLNNDIDQDCTADFNNGTNPNYTSELRNETGMDYTSSYNNGTGLSNATRSGNGICCNSGTGTTSEACLNNNRPDSNLNGSGLQNNGPGSQNNRQDLNIPGFSNNGSGLNINDLRSNNSSVVNNNSPVPNNIPVLKKDPDSNNNARPDYATSHNNSFSSNKDADSNYDTKPIAAGHNYSAVPNYYSDLDYIPKFAHALGSSFVVNPNYIAQISYATRLSSTTGNVNVTDTNTSNITGCGGAISPNYITCISFASNTNYKTRFTHVIAFNFVINKYYTINTLNVYNSTSTGKINHLSEPKLEIGFGPSIPNIVYGSTPTFAAGTNYTSTPENLTTSTFSDSYKFGGNYTVIDYHKFGVCSKGSDGSVDCAIFMHATEFKDVLDAKDSGLLKDFSSIQNPIGIKDPASVNFHSKLNILLLSFNIIEAEQPDVMKFAISSGAVNQFFKSVDNYCSTLRAEEGSSRGAMQETTKISSKGHAWESAEGLAQESPRGTAWGLKRGLPVISVREHAMNPAGGCTERCAKEHTVSPVRGLSEKPEWGLAVSPARGRAVNPMPGHAERNARGHTMSPTRKLAVSPARRYAVSPEREHAARHARGHAMSPTKRLVVSSARGRSMTPAIGHAETHTRGHAMSPTKRLAVSSARGRSMTPARGHAETHTKGHAVSPTRGLAMNPARGYAAFPARDRSVNPTREHAERYARGHTVSPTRGLAGNPTRGYVVSPTRTHAERHARGHSVSPTRRRTVSPARGYAERHARQNVWSPLKRYAMSSVHGLVVGQAGRTTGSPARELILGSIVKLTVKPAEGYAGKTSKRSAKRSTRSITDKNRNRRRFPIVSAFIKNFMKAKVQNWLNLSWLRRVMPSFFSEEDRFFGPRPRFCTMACTELGQGKCEGWLWKKRKSTEMSFFGWKRYWFILKQSTLYWFSHLNDTKAVGFIYLPEFRIDFTPHCSKSNVFQASHARIESLYFAAVCPDEMNYWIGHMLQLAYGSSFGNAAANEECRHVCAAIYENGVFALTREFFVNQCNICHHPTTVSTEYHHFNIVCDGLKSKFYVDSESLLSVTALGELPAITYCNEKINERVVSLSPNFRHKDDQDVPDEFIYFRPIDAEFREEARRQKQQKPTMTSHQHTREEHSHPRIPINLWLKSLENAQSPGGDNLGVARSMSPVRERPIIRRSWQELLEAPLNSEGLHILQTVPPEEREIDSLQLPAEDKNQATNSLRSRHLHALQGPFPLLPQHPKLRRQRSHSLPGYSDSSSPKLNAPALKANPQETYFLPSDDTLFTQGNAKEKDSIEDTWQKAILPASAGQPPINPSFVHSSEMRGQLGIPGDNGKHPRGNARVPMDNVINPMVNVGVPMGNVGVSVDKYRIPMGDATLPLDNFEVPRGSGGAPMGNLKVPRGTGDGGVPRRHGIRIPVGNVETLKNNVGTSRRVISSPLIELSKIGEHQL